MVEPLSSKQTTRVRFSHIALILAVPVKCKRACIRRYRITSGCRKMVNPPVLGTGECWFEPSHPHGRNKQGTPCLRCLTVGQRRFALIAQRIERHATDVKVGGSNPSGCTRDGRFRFDSGLSALWCNGSTSVRLYWERWALVEPT